ncbi:phage tail protein [Methylosinus sp. H3A]|uniref:phage tail-collar fiber domain-containing protein n=1 Tax=Methylosinus sp. H3A TaxID=2785786 RepID=UPI0018C274A0|nr:phage tail protein [Methylosinus sp. H3A]MBG0809846.1 phage tail protein [Methylosinus sp. H3A]
MTVYATKVSAAYIARRQAAQAGGAQVNFLAGQIILGDGNGAVPAISDLVAAGGVIHEVWRGSVITSVTVDSANPAQVDVRAVIPSSVGGFWVREFVILDENGVACIYGQTLVEKTSAAQGQTSDLSLVAAIAESDTGVVVLSPPSADYATVGALQAAINAHQPTAESPLYAEDTISGGWLQRLFRVRRSNLTQIGVERPANDAEFAAGVGSLSPWPWPTLAQVKNALHDIAVALTGSGEGVTIDNTHRANLDFPSLSAAADIAAADSIALYQSVAGHHRKWSLSAFLTWLRTQSGFGTGVGQTIVTSAAGTWLEQNPADWGYSLGMAATSAQLAAGSVPNVTASNQYPYTGATNTASAAWFGAITGNWQLSGWAFCNNAGFVAVYNLYWTRVS